MVADFMTKDIVSCRITEKISEVTQRLNGAGNHYCPVVNDDKVLLGVFRVPSSASQRKDTVDTEMELGPATFRANAKVEQAAAFMSTHSLSEICITNSDGMLLGVLTRQVADHAVDGLGREK